MSLEDCELGGRITIYSALTSIHRNHLVQPAVSYECILFNWGIGACICKETLLDLAGNLDVYRGGDIYL